MDLIQLFATYNIQDTSFLYGAYSDPIPSRKYVKTTGSSTTVVSATASSGALDEVAVGYEMAVNRDGDVDVRYVTAKASGDSITINSAVDWGRDASDTGYPYQFRYWNNGTAATSGWFGVDQFDDKGVQLIVTTLGSTSIEAIIEGRLKGSQTTNTILWPLWSSTSGYSFTATGSVVIPITEAVDEIRVGFKRTGAGTNSVSAIFRGRRRA